MIVAGLYRYPVKSLGGGALDSADIEPRGIAGDRRWMVVDQAGRMVTRRECPAMARVAADYADADVVLRDADGASLTVAEPGPNSPLRAVRVWRDTPQAGDGGDAAAAWLSQRLGRSVRLVFMPDAVIRAVDPAYAAPGDRVGFADGFPLLVTLTESLAALNAALPAPLAMARFRPNLVIAGGTAFAEQGWRGLRIGTLVLRLVKPCTRCVITTQDPATGATTGDHQPLPALRALGQVWRGQPVFGQNAIASGSGTIAVGDPVEAVG